MTQLTLKSTTIATHAHIENELKSVSNYSQLNFEGAQKQSICYDYCDLCASYVTMCLIRLIRTGMTRHPAQHASHRLSYQSTETSLPYQTQTARSGDAGIIKSAGRRYRKSPNPCCSTAPTRLLNPNCLISPITVAMSKPRLNANF